MLSVRQVVPSLLLVVSIALFIEALHLPQKVGRAATGAPSGTNLQFENTTILVEVGVYRFIRHPMYASVLALGWGALRKSPSVIGVGLAAGASALCAEHVRQLGGESPLHNLMEVK